MMLHETDRPVPRSLLTPFSLWHIQYTCMHSVWQNAFTCRPTVLVLLLALTLRKVSQLHQEKANSHFFHDILVFLGIHKSSSTQVSRGSARLSDSIHTK